MKKFLPILILGIVAMISFSACSKDDDNQKESVCVIGGTSHALTSSYADYWEGNGEDEYETFCLFFLSGDEQFQINFCNLYCPSDEPVIANGTYPSESQGLYYDQGDTAYTTDGWESEVYLSGDEKITVKGFGNNVYEFTWTGTDENGLNVSGYYKGVVEMRIPLW